MVVALFIIYFIKSIHKKNHYASYFNIIKCLLHNEKCYYLCVGGSSEFDWIVINDMLKAVVLKGKEL